MEELLKQILARLDKIDEKLEKVDDKVDKVAIEVGVLHQGHRDVMAQLFDHTARLGHVEKQVDSIDRKLSEKEGKLTDKVENRDSEYNARFLKIEQAVEELRKLLPPSGTKAKKKAR